MSWTNELYNVYEKNCGKADNVPLLLPISHSTANAQIEVTLNENGDPLYLHAYSCQKRKIYNGKNKEE